MPVRVVVCEGTLPDGDWRALLEETFHWTQSAARDCDLTVGRRSVVGGGAQPGRVRHAGGAFAQRRGSPGSRACLLQLARRAGAPRRPPHGRPRAPGVPLDACTGPGVFFRSSDESGLHWIILDIGLNPQQLGLVPHPMIVGFLLPEGFPCAIQEPAALPRLAPFNDFSGGSNRFWEESRGVRGWPSPRKRGVRSAQVVPLCKSN